MTVLLYSVICAAAATFVVASVARAVRYARSPLHLRWELYPVPHEAPKRVEHGGSYFETSEWWTVPRHFSLVGELRFMIPEMLFLKGLRESNRPLWYRSFPFHFGLYLLACSVMLLLLVALGTIVQLAPTTGGLGPVLHGLAAFAGLSGLALSILGACALLHRRMSDASLRSYTTAGDVFNLLAFVVALGLTGIGYLLRPEGSPGALAVTNGLLSWDTAIIIPGPFAVGLVAAAALVAYIPLTHMSHFIAKYFTYHAVRWDDTPISGNEKKAARLAEYLTYKPTWSAGHIGADGTRTWAEIASSSPAETKR